jgi:hypothetical protein
VPGHEWAERLPAIIDEAPLVAVGPGLEVDRPEPVAVGPGLSTELMPDAASALALNFVDTETEQAGASLP